MSKNNAYSMIEAFKTLFSDDYFRYNGGITLTPGRSTDDDVLQVELKLAIESDEESLRMLLMCGTGGKVDNYGDATVYLEPEGCMAMGAALIGFALAHEGKNNRL